MMVLLRMQLMPFRLMLGGRVSGEGTRAPAFSDLVPMEAQRRSHDGPQGEPWPESC